MSKRITKVIVAKEGKPMARLLPVAKNVKRKLLGRLTGKINVPEDFDEPLPDDILAPFEGRQA